MNILRALAVTLLVAGLAACTAGEAGGIGTATSFNVANFPPAEREPAPSISGERLDQAGTITDALIQGKVGVVNFWGSWCGPCRKEQPLLEALWREYAPRGVAFVGINTRRDNRAAAVAFLEEFQVSYPSVYDPPSSIASDFGVRAMPSTFVIDREGRIAAHIIGALRNEADLRLILDAELLA
ncbi:MAG TPA: TlpA disulfide reductase family protein [Actinomycetota bacterium]